MRQRMNTGAVAKNRVISGLLWMAASYSCLCVAATSASAACDFPDVNIVMAPSGAIAIDHTLVQCDAPPSSITVHLHNQFTGLPESQTGLGLGYLSGPADLIFPGGLDLHPDNPPV